MDLEAVLALENIQPYTVQSLYGKYTIGAASRLEQWVAGTVLLITSTFLLLTNITVATVMKQLITNRGFAILFIGSVTFESCSLFCLSLMVAPVIMFDWNEFGTGIGGNVIATIAFCSYNNLMLLLIVVAVNRYVAITRPPVQYKMWFSPRNTVIIMGICLVLALSYSVPHFLPQCTADLNPRWLGLSYDPDKCGQFLNVHCIAICSFSALTAAAINLCTYIKMHKMNDDISLSSHADTSNCDGTTEFTASTTHSSNNSRRAQRKHARRQQEIRFFKQSVLNMFSLQAMTILFHVIALLWNKPLGYFILAQAPLAIYHGSNALTMLSIHPQLRHLIWEQIESALTTKFRVQVITLK